MVVPVWAGLLTVGAAVGGGVGGSVGVSVGVSVDGLVGVLVGANGGGVGGGVGGGKVVGGGVGGEVGGGIKLQLMKLLHAHPGATPPASYAGTSRDGHCVRGLPPCPAHTPSSAPQSPLSQQPVQRVTPKYCPVKEAKHASRVKAHAVCSQHSLGHGGTLARMRPQLMYPSTSPQMQPPKPGQSTVMVGSTPKIRLGLQRPRVPSKSHGPLHTEPP